MEDILRKIAALMAKANGTENEHEAAVFAAKAQEMLAKHNLAMMDVLEGIAAERRETVTQVEVENKHTPSDWHKRLLGAVARFYFCRSLFCGSKFLLVGKLHNAAVAASMFGYLKKTTERLALEWARAEGDIVSLSECLNFKHACGLRLAERLYRMFQEQQGSGSPTGTTLPALHESETKAIDEFLARAYPNRTPGLINEDIVGRGGAAGYRAGGEISLQTQVSNAAAKQLQPEQRPLGDH